MSTIHKRALLLLALLSSPSFAFAAVGNVGFDGLNALIMSFANGVVRSTGYMMFTLAVVAFFFGIVQFIWSSRQGSEGKGIQRGKQFMMWGLIGLFVMFSVWGIVKFAQGVLGIQGDNTIIIPSLDFKSSGVQGVTGSGNLFSTGSNVATGITTSGITNQEQATQLYNYCLKNGGNSTSCANAANNALANNPAYNGSIPSTGAASGANSGINTQAQADQLYNYCVQVGKGDPAACKTAAQAALSSNTSKADGETCGYSGECKSSFCNGSNVCETVTAANKLSNGSDCYQDAQCSSDYCSLSNGTCSDKPSNTSNGSTLNSNTSDTGGSGSGTAVGGDAGVLPVDSNIVNAGTEFQYNTTEEGQYCTTVGADGMDAVGWITNGVCTVE